MRARGCVALLAVGATLLAGCGSESQDKIDAANRQAEAIKASARTAIADERSAANDELADIRSQISHRRDDLATVKRALRRDRAELERLKKQVSGARAQIAANTIPGTGTFVVGQDIQPGTYRADPQDGCYWARLSSLNTSDIIDNDNAAGPVVVEVQASDKAFYANDCADFHKVAPGE